MTATLLGTLALGFVLGLKHALDGDHLVAVTTVVGRERSLWRSALVGALWGAGHTASLFVAAVLVIVLRVTITPRVALTLELAVGVMLILLGLDLLRRVRRGDLRLHSHAHAHDGDRHVHFHVHAEPLAPAAGSHHAIGRRPFVVGLVHGLAGSAALMLFVLSTIASPWLGVGYVLVFGLGTIAGMLVMSTLIGLPFVLAARRAAGLGRGIQLAAALGSVAFGAAYTWGIAVENGLVAPLLR